MKISCLCKQRHVHMSIFGCESTVLYLCVWDYSGTHPCSHLCTCTGLDNDLLNMSPSNVMSKLSGPIPKYAVCLSIIFSAKLRQSSFSLMAIVSVKILKVPLYEHLVSAPLSAKLMTCWMLAINIVSYISSCH